jgi:hypothetical protein
MREFSKKKPTINGLKLQLNIPMFFNFLIFHATVLSFSLQFHFRKEKYPFWINAKSLYVFKSNKTKPINLKIYSR